MLPLRLCFVKSLKHLFGQLSMRKPLSLKPCALASGSAKLKFSLSRLWPHLTSLTCSSTACCPRPPSAETPRLITYSAKVCACLHCSTDLSSCDCSDMSHRPLFLALRLVRQHFARSRCAIYSAVGHRLQWRGLSSSAAPTCATDVPRRLEWKRYSAAEDREIMRMKAQNYDWATIASALPGRRAKGVERRFYLALSVFENGKNVATIPSEPDRRRKFTMEELSTLSEMLEKGFHCKAIARHLGRTPNSVSRKYLSLGMSKRIQPLGAGIAKAKKSRWTTADDELLVRLHGMGLHTEAIARNLGRSVYAVEHRYKLLLPYRTTTKLLLSCISADV